jgi:hypothetical protein
MRTRNKWFVVAGGLILCVVIFYVVALPRYREFQANIRGRNCVYHLEEFEFPLLHYAGDHDGRYPDRISDLYPEYVSDLQAFICPEVSARCKRELGKPHPFSDDPSPEEIDELSSYAIVPGVTGVDISDVEAFTKHNNSTLIAYEKENNHKHIKRLRLNLAGQATWDSGEYPLSVGPPESLEADPRVVWRDRSKADDKLAE